ncbi:MAG: PEP-CTERM sorting domain-containing protein [Geobacter sp.]|nr:PEP-CTERM sorting domain-containing protein [Geobacter sp.]
MRYWVGIVIGFAFLGIAEVSQAVVLFDNGQYSGHQSNIRNIIEPGFTQMIYDDFTLDRDYVITGFKWSQHDGINMVYIATNLTIFNGLPIEANTLINRDIIAERTENNTNVLWDNWYGYDYSIHNLKINLAAGTYFLGLNSVIGTGVEAIWDDSSWDETDGNLSTIPGRYIMNYNFTEPGSFSWWQDSVFEVIGHPAPVPEPSTIFLLGAGLVGLAAYGRKKSKK